MADEEKNEEQAAEEQAETPEAAEEEQAAEAEAEPVAEASADEGEAAAAPAPAGDGDEEDSGPLSPRQERKLERSRFEGEAAEPRTPEQRASDRVDSRKAKAASRRRARVAERAKRGEPQEGTPPAEREPGTQKVRQGIVTSAKADKTITVRIESARRHPAYEKIVRRSKSLHAHDENNEAGAGDTVRVIESRPMSKTKRWRLVEVVEKAK